MTYGQGMGLLASFSFATLLPGGSAQGHRVERVKEQREAGGPGWISFHRVTSQIIVQCTVHRPEYHVSLMYFKELAKMCKGGIFFTFSTFL